MDDSPIVLKHYKLSVRCYRGGRAVDAGDQGRGDYKDDEAATSDLRNKAFRLKRDGFYDMLIFQIYEVAPEMAARKVGDETTI